MKFLNIGQIGMTESGKERVRISKLGNKNRLGKTHSEFTKLKISKSKKKNPTRYWLGKKRAPVSEETRKKISKSNLGKKRQPFPEEWREKQRIAKLGLFSGEKHWNWQGGISKIDRKLRNLREYVNWRKFVFERDNWTCQTCGISGCYVTAHHIKGFSKIIKDNNIINSQKARRCSELWDTSNGVTLCEDCHKLTDNYAGRAKAVC